MNNKNPNKKTSPRGKAALLLLVILVSVITALPVFYSTNAGAVNAYADMSQGDQIKAYLYTNALTSCFKDAALSHDYNLFGSNIVAVDVPTGKWFHATKNWWEPGIATSNEVVGIGAYLNGASGVKDGKVSCGDASFINDALSFLGLDPIAVLCNSGFVREDVPLPQTVEKCMTTTTNLHRGGDKGDSATKFVAYINSQVGAQSFTDAQWYAFYRGTLANSCIPGITAAPNTTLDVTGNDKGYKDVKWVDITTDPANPKIITGSYIGAMEPGKEVYQSSDPSGNDVKNKCQGIVDKMSTLAQAFSEWAKLNPDDAGELMAAANPNSGTDPEDDKSCGAQVTALGWIICPIINGLTKLNDAMWGLVSGLLFVSPLDSSTKLYDAWGSIRSIANVVFVAFFLIIILSQLSGAGISNYGVKKLLPKIIVAAILVNLSFIIVQVAVDLANVIGYSLYNLLKLITPTIDPAKSNWVALVTLLEGVGVAGAAATGVLATIIVIGGIAAAFWMLLPIALMAALGLLVAVLTLIFRQAVIPVLAILAPLAFVAYLLPNTESWFKKWLKLFMSMLMMFPLAAVVFGGAQFASYTIIGDGKDFWNLLIGLIILTMPLFSLPFLARQGGPLLTKVGGAMKGVTDKARAPLSNFAKSYQDRDHDRYLAGDSSRLAKGLRSRFNNNRFVGENSRLGRTGLGRLGNRAVNGTPMQKTARWMQGGKLVRAEEAETAKKEFKSQVFNDQVKGVKGSPTRMKSIDRSKNDQSDAKEQASQHAASPIGEKSVDRLGKAELQTTVDSGDAEHRLATDLTPGGGRDLHQAVKISQGESAIDKKKIDRRYDTSAEGRILGRQLGERELLKKSDDAATANRVAGSRVGQIGHQAVSEGQGRTAVDAKGIEHRYSTSVAGMTLDNQLGNANLQGQIDDKATAHRVATDYTIGGGAQLTYEAGKANLQGQIDEKGAAHTLATDDTTIGGGANLMHAVGTAELLAQQDKNIATTKVETDAGLLNIRMKTATTDKQLSTAKAQNTQLVTEASTTGAVIPELDAETRSDLQTAQLEGTIASTATAQATGVINQEYAKTVTTPSAGGGPSEVAVRAGGIAGASGVARVEAGATATMDRFNRENVDAAKVLLSSQSYNADELNEIARGHLRSTVTGVPGAIATIEQQQAATEKLAEQGYEPDTRTLFNTINAQQEANERVVRVNTANAAAGIAGPPIPIPYPDVVDLSKTFASALMKSPKKPLYIRGTTTGQLARGEITGDDKSVIIYGMLKGKLSTSDLSRMSAEEMQEMSDVFALDEAGKFDQNRKFDQNGGHTPQLSEELKKDIAKTIRDALADDTVNDSFAKEHRDSMSHLLAVYHSYDPGIKQPDGTYIPAATPGDLI